MVLALVLVMAAAAAPGALAARQSGYRYVYDSELGAARCLSSKKACEQARANDPRALSECIKQNKIFRRSRREESGPPPGRPALRVFLMESSPKSNNTWYRAGDHDGPRSGARL